MLGTIVPGDPFSISNLEVSDTISYTMPVPVDLEVNPHRTYNSALFVRKE